MSSAALRWSICLLTYYFVERPCMKKASGVTKRIKGFWRLSGLSADYIPYF